MTTSTSSFAMGYYETGEGATREVRLARFVTAHGSWALLDADTRTGETRIVTQRLHDVEEATDTADDYLDLARSARRPVDELWR